MSQSQVAAETGYVDVNGLHMYYELYGDGSPLVLLHGGMLTIDLNFARLARLFRATSRQEVIVDS